jgi:hypothetical protein
MEFGSIYTRPELVARLIELGWLASGAEPTDEQVRAAIVSYQKQFKIELTGDVCNTTARSLAHLRFCAHSDRMAVTLEARWPAGPIGVHVAAAFPGLDLTQTQQSFISQMDKWTAVCGIELYYQVNPKTADIYATVGHIDGPAGVLAYSQLADNTRTPKQQQYDSGEKWVVSDTPQRFQIDAGRVIGHELGHAFGMPHIDAGNWLQPFYDVNINGPKAGDIQWMQANYGPPKPTAKPKDEVLMLVVSVSPDDVAKYLAKGYKVVRTLVERV